MRQLGGVYGPYTGTCFSSTMQTDIEHIVATNEAHDSGLCAADRATRTRFAQDLRNLTLASPEVNRHQKSGKDAGEWLPDRNRCWFAGRIIEVKRAYKLTVDRREAAALERLLRRCANTDMEPLVCRAGPASAGDTRRGAAGDDLLARYDDNRNGRITCKEARRHPALRPCPRVLTGGRAMDDREQLLHRINRDFAHRGIELPVDATSPGKVWLIVQRGWTIWTRFDTSAEDGRERLDYYSMHRMASDGHVRLYADGERENLPVMAESYVIAQGATKAECEALRSRFFADNQAVERLLDEKGFVMTDQAHPSAQVSRYFKTNPDA